MTLPLSDLIVEAMFASLPELVDRLGLEAIAESALSLLLGLFARPILLDDDFDFSISVFSTIAGEKEVTP